MTVQEAIENWVEKYCTNQYWLRMAGAGGCFLLSALVLFLTYWISYFIISIFFSSIIGPVLGAWLVMVLIFAVYVAANSGDLAELKVDSPSQVHARRTSPGNGLRHAVTENESFRSFMRILDVSILAGPALLLTGLKLIASARRLKFVDPALASEVLIILAKSGKKVPFSKILEETEGRTADEVIGQMTLIDGVVVRLGESPGMYLTDSLREDLVAAREARKKETF